MLVTHDIDEAVRMADRVAVLSPGAHIEQLASPLDIVARPATDAVADLVGRGRIARLLALGRLDRADLEPARPGDAGEAVELGAELGDVLAAFVAGDRESVPVRAGEDVVGSVTPASVLRALRRLTDDAAEVAGGAPTGAGPAGGADEPVGTLPS
jgi:osmoprotectant transport system ATP-binding protein